jgi:hypothetical protein
MWIPQGNRSFSCRNIEGIILLETIFKEKKWAISKTPKYLSRRSLPE